MTNQGQGRPFSLMPSGDLTFIPQRKTKIMLKIEAAIVTAGPTEGSGSGRIEVRHVPSGSLIKLAVDASLLLPVVREQVSALCAVAGVTGEDRLSLMATAAGLARQCLESGK